MQTTTQETERRSKPRRACRVPVRVRVDGDEWHDSFLLDSRDIADGSVFLRSDLLLPLGQEVEVELPLSYGTQPIRRLGRVVRVSGRTLRSDPGFVIGLFGLNDAERRSLGLDAPRDVQ